MKFKALMLVLLLFAGCGIAIADEQPAAQEEVTTADQTNWHALAADAQQKVSEAEAVQQYLHEQHAIQEYWKADFQRRADEWRAEQAAKRAAAKRSQKPPAWRAGHGPGLFPDKSRQRCGGDLPPCWVLARESGGNIHAYNPTGCANDRLGPGCSGKWQCSRSTCDGTGSEDQQDAEARRVWDGGRGCAHWNAC